MLYVNMLIISSSSYKLFNSYSRLFCLFQDLKFKLPKVSSSGFRVRIQERVPWKLKQVPTK